MSTVYDLYRDAELYLAEGNPRRAVAVLDEALVQEPGDPGLLRLLARGLFAFAALGRAEQVLRTLLDRDPVDAGSAALLGRVLSRQGRPAEALPWTRLAVLLDPSLEPAAPTVQVSR
ncbi:MAG: hypothetical protein JWN87_2696 [Frankiales bacterium]|jgi:predicted Zn-dependent protease|nr:hypothetical protein [Frankiales bacterium]